MRKSFLLLCLTGITTGQISAQTQTVVNGAATAPVNFKGNNCLFHWVNNQPAIGLPASGSGNIASFTAINTSDAPVVATVTATPTPMAYAFIPNEADNSVSVVNTINNTVVATIAVGNTPEAVTTNHAGTILFVALPASIQSYDMTTYTPIATYNVVGRPLFIAIDPNDQFLYAANNVSNDVTEYDVASTALIATTPVGNGPLDLALSPDGTLTYACGPSNTVSVIDNGSHAVTVTIPVAGSPQEMVNPTPNVTVSAVSGYISACGGTPSASPAVQQFSVSAANVPGAVTATAPTGFEVSLSGTTGFGNSVTLTPVSGAIAGQPVYVRSAASAPDGTIYGNVALTEGGVPEDTVPVNGFIKTLPVVDQAANQTVLNGTATTAVNFTGTGIGDTYSWTNNTPGIGLAASGTGNIPSFAAINTGSAPVVATITVTTRNPGFAFIGNNSDSAGNTVVTLINTATNAVVDAIGVSPGPYGMWLSPGGGQLYVGSVASNYISIINTSTGKVTGKIPSAFSQQGLVGSADGRTLYVADFGGETVSVINTITQAVTATIYVGMSPVGICLTPDGRTLYVANVSAATVSVISTATNTVTATINAGQGPAGILASPDGSKIYVALQYENKLGIISTATNTINKIPVGNAPHALAISADGSTIYIANENENTVSVFNTATDQVTATIPCGNLPNGVALSPDGSLLYVTNYLSHNVTVINTSTNSVIQTVPIGANTGSLGAFVGSSGCPSAPMTFTITVNPTAPSIVATGTLNPMTTVYGTPSPSDTFTISGTHLKTGMPVTPPSGFEVSTDGITFSPTVTVGTTEVVAPTTIYIRLTATTPAGTYSGNIVIGSTGAASQNVAVPNSTVTPAPLTITVNDTSRPYGQQNPIFLYTYSGFQNNETAAVLTTPPQGATTATTYSPVGSYPVTPEGADDPNYTFTYVPGTLKINLDGVYVSVPGAFTPNGDGINDTWVIRNLAAFTRSTVTVFNRYGQTVFASTGYGTPWNATQKGSEVPAGTYVYIIDLGNGAKPMKGTVVVMR